MNNMIKIAASCAFAFIISGCNNNSIVKQTKGVTERQASSMINSINIYYENYMVFPDSIRLMKIQKEIGLDPEKVKYNINGIRMLGDNRKVVVEIINDNNETFRSITCGVLGNNGDNKIRMHYEIVNMN